MASRLAGSFKGPLLSELGSYFVFSLTLLWASGVLGFCRICDCFETAEVGHC